MDRGGRWPVSGLVRNWASCGRPRFGQQPGSLVTDNRPPAANSGGKVIVQGRTEKAKVRCPGWFRVARGQLNAADYHHHPFSWPPNWPSRWPPPPMASEAAVDDRRPATMLDGIGAPGAYPGEHQATGWPAEIWQQNVL